MIYPGVAPAPYPVPAYAPRSYPVRMEVQRPWRQSKLLNFPFVSVYIRGLLLLPSLLVLFWLFFAAWTANWLASWAILFTGRYPRGFFKLQVGCLRWQANASAYLASLFDEYPPMDEDQRPDRPLVLEVDFPHHPSRLLNLPFFPVKWLLVIPHLLALMCLWLLASVMTLIAQVAILSSGSFPPGLHDFVLGTQRWAARVTAYVSCLVDRYPPFSLH